MRSGDLIRKPDRRVKLLVTTQLVWGAALIVLALWWGTFLQQQSDEIATLQTQLGVSKVQIDARLDKTTRMVTGESGFFILLILITNGVLLYFFVRDSRRSRSLQAFFASITHELRTPLTSIRLQAETLQDIEDNPRHRPFIERLLEDVHRLDGQVQRSLELARIESGGTLNLQVIELGNFVQNKILPQYAQVENRIQIQVDLPESFIRADLTALNIIFRNLIDNAIKYTASEPAKIRIQAKLEPSTLLVQVIHLNADTEHLASTDASQLGELFYRGANSQGAGVGLYLIRSLMNKMSGKATYHTENQNFSATLEFLLDPQAHEADTTSGGLA